MIEHPEDYSGPSLPCGDLTGAPVGAGEEYKRPGACQSDSGPYPTCGASCWYPRCDCYMIPRPNGGWSDSGPAA